MATHEDIPARAAEVDMVSNYLAADRKKYVEVMTRVGKWGWDANPRVDGTIYPSCSAAAKYFLFRTSSYERHKFFSAIRDVYGIQLYAEEQGGRRVVSADTSVVGAIMGHMQSASVRPICLPPCAQTIAASTQHITGEDTATDIERLECAVCKENEKVVMVTPCNHICFCIGCANAVIDKGTHDAKCPVCRGEAKTFVKAFF